MSRSRSTPHVFEANIAVLLERLRGDRSPRAGELRREVEELRDLFETWHHRPPIDADRLGTIHRLFDVFRATMDYRPDK